MLLSLSMGRLVGDRMVRANLLHEALMCDDKRLFVLQSKPQSAQSLVSW